MPLSFIRNKVIGYSRHGRFYHPFNVIPDYNLRELLYNYIDISLIMKYLGCF